MSVYAKPIDLPMTSVSQILSIVRLDPADLLIVISDRELEICISKDYRDLPIGSTILLLGDHTFEALSDDVIDLVFQRAEKSDIYRIVSVYQKSDARPYQTLSAGAA